MPELGVKTHLILTQLCPVIADFTPRGGGHSNNEEQVGKKKPNVHACCRFSCGPHPLSVAVGVQGVLSPPGWGLCPGAPPPDPYPAGGRRAAPLPSPCSGQPGRAGILSVTSPVVSPPGEEGMLDLFVIWPAYEVLAQVTLSLSCCVLVCKILGLGLFPALLALGRAGFILIGLLPKSAKTRGSRPQIFYP